MPRRQRRRQEAGLRRLRSARPRLGLCRPGYDKAKLEQSIENHADWVFGVAFAPDGKHLLTCSRDKTAKVWDLETKESVLTFPDHQNTVYGVAVKADGKIGYSVGEDNQLRAWNLTGDAAGKQVRATGGHGKADLQGGAGSEAAAAGDVQRRPDGAALERRQRRGGEDAERPHRLRLRRGHQPGRQPGRFGIVQRRGQGLEDRRRHGGQGVQRLAGVQSAGRRRRSRMV